MNLNWNYSPETLNSDQNQWFCVPCDVEIWWGTLKNIRAPLLCYFKLWVSFCSHWWIWSYSPKTPSLGKKRRFFLLCDLEIWWMTVKNNRAPLLYNIKLFASFHHHMWIQTRVTVRKRLGWVLTSATLTSDLDLFMDITFVNGNNSWKSHDDTMTGTLWNRCHRRTDSWQTNRHTEGQTDRSVLRAAWSQLKILKMLHCLLKIVHT